MKKIHKNLENLLKMSVQIRKFSEFLKNQPIRIGLSRIGPIRQGVENVDKKKTVKTQRTANDTERAAEATRSRQYPYRRAQRKFTKRNTAA